MTVYKPRSEGVIHRSLSMRRPFPGASIPGNAYFDRRRLVLPRISAGQRKNPSKEMSRRPVKLIEAPLYSLLRSPLP